MIRRLLARIRGDQPARGTLTLLADGRAIVGLPADVPHEVASRVGEQVREYLTGGNTGGRVLVFPWPVDVRDQRHG